MPSNKIVIINYQQFKAYKSKDFKMYLMRLN